MKKIFLVIAICFIAATLFAQTKGQTNVSDTTCFCCEGFYNLPSPQVTGPIQVNCADKPKYSIPNCKGAVINWAVTPNVGFTGNGTNSITLTPPLSAASYTIKVTIRCGSKEVGSTLVVKVNTVQNCTANFLTTLNLLPGGTVNINTVPDTKAGAFHYWGIVYNGTYPNYNIPCVSIPFANFSNPFQNGIFGATVSETGLFTPIGQGTNKTAGTSGWGINYSFPVNSCFKITHYINCCGEWKKQTHCVSYGVSALKSNTLGQTVPPLLNIEKTEVEVVDEKDLPKEINAVKEANTGRG